MTRSNFLQFIGITVVGMFALAFKGQAQTEDFPMLLWEDNFDSGTQLNPEFWNYELGDGCDYGICGWGNNEEQYYTDRSENVRLVDGKLVIETRKESMGGKPYTSARITTKGKKAFQHGRMEIRAKIPGGKGIWGAIWMLGENIDQVGWPACGEIDIMEHVGFEPDIVHATMHTPSSNGASQNSGSITKTDFEEDFHVYTVEKTADKMRFFVDDQLFYTYNPSTKNTSTWPFEQNFFFILNTAVGGNWGGQQGIDDNIFPQKMEVDYVRVYGEADISISGENYLPAGAQNVSFQTQFLDGATYEWVVPEGVELVSGQGTSEVKVNWNDKNGEIKVKLDWKGQTFEASLSVEITIVPLETFHLDISPESWEIPNEFLGLFQLATTEEGTEIKFNASDPSRNPYLLLKLSQPLSMEIFSKLSLILKTEQSPSNMRIDLLDIEGKSNGSPHLFKLEPFNADGKAHHYSYYFEEGFSSSNLNEGMIKELKIYLNYGILGKEVSGSLMIADLYVDEAEESPLPFAPLVGQAGALENSISLSWEDVAENEQGYKIFRKVKGAEVFEEMEGHLPVDQTVYQDNALGSETTYIYKIAAFNQFGKADGEELEVTSPLITAIGNKPVVEEYNLLLKPNPAIDELRVECRGGKMNEAVLVIRNDLGQIVWKESFREFKSKTLNVSTFNRGIYILQLSSKHKNYVRKLVIR